MIVLVINCGSSSLKYQVYDMSTETALADGLADRVGINNGTQAILKHRPVGKPTFEVEEPMADHTAAVKHVFAALTDPEHGVLKSLSDIAAVGHRVLHGGAKFSASVLVDDDVIQAIKECIVLGPLHNPGNLQGIQACAKALPGVPQVAVFDTAFHQTMPQHAFLYGVPWEYYVEHNIRRYGFHGTSHRYVTLKATQWLKDVKGIPVENQRVVTCHLGNGASMAAVKAGKCIDTSMGLTPQEGLLMGTRAGDMDPAIVGIIMQMKGYDPQQIDTLLNKESGLLGLTGVSSDMRDVKAAALADPPNPRAVAALEVFCYRIVKYLGAYAAALGGLDAVVFTAGIGENEPMVRERTTSKLGFLGIGVDPAKNAKVDKSQDVIDISAEGTTVSTIIIPTNEELMIARDTAEIVSEKSS